MYEIHTLTFGSLSFIDDGDCLVIRFLGGSQEKLSSAEVGYLKEFLRKHWGEQS